MMKNWFCYISLGKFSCGLIISIYCEHCCSLYDMTCTSVLQVFVVLIAKIANYNLYTK